MTALCVGCEYRRDDGVVAEAEFIVATPLKTSGSISCRDCVLWAVDHMNEGDMLTVRRATPEQLREVVLRTG